MITVAIFSWKQKENKHGTRSEKCPENEQAWNCRNEHEEPK